MHDIKVRRLAGSGMVSDQQAARIILSGLLVRTNIEASVSSLEKRRTVPIFMRTSLRTA
jgi:hypothetical protein